MNARRLVCAVGAVVMVLLPSFASGETVLLLWSQSGRIDFLDPTTLRDKGHLVTERLTESVVATPDGKTLLIRAGSPTEPHGCCSLFALDLSTRRSKELLSICTSAVIAAGANKIVAHQGNVGIELFRLSTLSRLPKIDAPSVYRLHPSPDGHWLFAPTQSAVDIFDLQADRLVRHIDVPSEGFLTGTWRKGVFFLYAQENDKAQLWSVDTSDLKLGTKVSIQLPGVSRSSFQLWNIGTVDQHLFVYEMYGTPFDDRSTDKTTPAGGLFEIDPSEASVVRSLASGLHFATVQASADGSKFYGIDLSSEDWEGVRLVKVHRQSGRLEAVRELPRGVAGVSLADIPAELIPKE